MLGLPADALLDPQDVLLCTGVDTMQAAGMVADLTGCRVVQLRASPRAAGPSDMSIYRYDQDALMAAIAGGQG